MSGNRIWVVFLLVIIMSFATSCTKDKKNAPAGDDSKTTSVSKAVEGGKIDTTKKADDGKTSDDDVTIITPPGGDKGGDTPPVLPKRDDGTVEPAKPIEGSITMDALVYPYYNLVTGAREKEPVGDAPNHTQTTTDPIVDVWFYYNQILEGRDMESKGDVFNNDPVHSARFEVHDGENEYRISISEVDVKGPVRIVIAKDK